MIKYLTSQGYKIWFTSDTHYFSNNVISYCYRPYNNVFDMNESMVNNYNNLVSDTDIVYILGDFCWEGRYEEMLKRLKGRKHIILGNHDNEKKLKECMYKGLVESVSETEFIKIDDDLVWLSHYPHRSWNSSFHGSYHLYGHMHNTSSNQGKSTDVGVDKWNYNPVDWVDIKKHLRGAKNEF